MNALWMRQQKMGLPMAALALLAADALAQDGSAPAPALATVEVRSAAIPAVTTEGRPGYAATHATVGGKDATPLLEIPQSVSVITRARIEDQNLQTAEDALRQVTGVTVTPWDGATSQIRSRGYFLEPSLDGIPGYGGLNATQQFDLAMFDRVEVLRGPSGLFQGSGQPGGSVNFVRRQGLSEFAGDASVSVGSWSQRQAQASVGGALNADRTLRSRIVLSGSDRDFHYDRAHGRRAMAYGALDYDLSPATTLSLYGAFQDDKTNPFSGLPAYADGRFIDAPRSTNPYPGWAVMDNTAALLAAEAEHRWSNGWKLRARYSRQLQDSDLRDSYPTAGVNAATGLVPYARRGWDSQTARDTVDVYASGPFRLLGRAHAATVGWNYGKVASDTDYGPNDTVPGISIRQPDAVPELHIPPYVRGYSDETRQRGIYGQLRLSLSDALTLVTGARASDFSVRSRSTVPGVVTPGWTQGARETGEISPYAALVVQLAPGTTAYGSYSDIFMPQTAKDAAGRTLQPRVGRQIELGVKRSLLDGRLLASAAVFRTRDENRSMPDTAHPGSFVQAGKVQVQGWEVELSGSPLAQLELSLGYARLDTRYLAHQTLAGTAFTLFEPRHSLKGYAHYRLGGGAWSVGGGVQITSAVIGTGVPGTREAGGYGIASVQLGYQISPQTSVALALNNAFDRHYYARVGGLNSYNTYGEPRSAMLTLRSQF
ncbi:TonB-dependent siderophore receptor [Comamonas endophytica]|uniref:TonB-dependent siderophore receptor n=1 Tax=Comamonas endophytica TaxID=2949090 RepID=A0ABY6GGL4_9BURK|nr:MULTISPECIES: TonB-dependent siderophore receptor [unclassified Acidovorax]MCD2513183.1 TonB-dependent siderophore receptor [Acidovorax sp. D4N7]UYG53470.1 TonB-dependent siderophore receptor [Acidovorax sp. 5MLIR]